MDAPINYIVPREEPYGEGKVEVRRPIGELAVNGGVLPALWRLSTSRCQGCNWVFYCCKLHQRRDWKAHRDFCKYAQNDELYPLRSLTNQEFCRRVELDRLCRLVSRERGTNYHLGFPTYRITSRPTILEAPPAMRPSTYQPSRQVERDDEGHAVALSVSSKEKWEHLRTWLGGRKSEHGLQRTLANEVAYSGGVLRGSDWAHSEADQM
eukprot:g56529.t1